MKKIFGIILVVLFVSSVQCLAEDRVFEIKAKKFSYTPNIIKVNKGETVKIRLVSEDVHHGLFIDGYGEETSARPGQDGNLEFVASKPGRFAFRCSVTCGEFHPYMIGYLTVLPNTRFNMFLALILIFGIGNIILLKFRKREENEQR